MAPIAYKKNFKPSPALQLFYAGGPLRLSPDESFAACACVEDVKVVDLASGAVSKTLQGDAELVTSLAVSPNGKSIFVASRSLQIKHWNLSEASVRRSWKAHDAPVPDMAVDASGGLLATASADRSVRVWDIDGGFCTHSFRGHKGVVTCVMFHPDPHRLLLFSGGDDATVRVWDLVTRKCAAVLEKHFSVVTSLAVSTNGWSLLSGARDKVVNVWSLRDYSHEGTVPVYEAVEAVCVIPDGCELPGSAVVDPAAKKKAMKPRFLTVGELGVIKVFSAEGAKRLYEQKSSDVRVPTEKNEHSRGFLDAFVLREGKGILCVTYDHRLLFYEPIKNEAGQQDIAVTKRLIGFSDEVTDLRFTGESGSMLAVASNVEQVRLYDLNTMACTHELSGHSDIVLCLDTCLSPQGRPLLASGGKDHTFRLWDVESGLCIAMAAGHMAAVGAVAFARRNRNFLVTGSRDRTIKVWSLEALLATPALNVPAKLSSQAVVAAHDKDINSLAVAPNDSLVCSGSQDTTARVWKLPELVLVSTLRGHKRGVWSVEFSPVDQCVLTASGDKTIRIWALSDSSCLKTFEGHTASVLKASFLSHGTQIISAGADGLLKLWTIKSNECINTFDQHTDKIWALTVNPQSEMLASGGSDSMVILWTDCTAADEQEAAMKEAEEALKDQELSNALSDTDFEKAVQLAFELRRPFKLLNVFTELFRAGGDSQVHSVLLRLDKEYLHLLLHYVREWNTKSKFCYVAQCVLQHLFTVFPPSELVKIPGVSELLEGIIPYTQRHFTRLDRLARSCFVLDYTLACMSVLSPVEAACPIPTIKPPLYQRTRFNPGGLKSFWNNNAGLLEKELQGDDNDGEFRERVPTLVTGEEQRSDRDPLSLIQATVTNDNMEEEEQQDEENNKEAEQVSPKSLLDGNASGEQHPTKGPRAVKVAHKAEPREPGDVGIHKDKEKKKKNMEGHHTSDGSQANGASRGGEKKRKKSSKAGTGTPGTDSADEGSAPPQRNGGNKTMKGKPLVEVESDDEAAKRKKKRQSSSKSS